MILPYLALLAAVCGPAFAVIRLQRNPWLVGTLAAEGVSFDDLVQKFAEKKARDAGTKVAWWDAYAQDPMLENHPEYQITVSTSPFDYKVTTNVEEKDRVTATTTHTNQDEEELSTRVTQTASYSSSSRWNLTRTLHLGAFLSTQAELPPALGGSVAVTMVRLDMGQTNINSNNNRNEPFTLTVPPKSVLDVDWVATDRYVTSEWEVTVDVGGYVAVYFDAPVDGANLKFYPVRDMANDDFRATENGVAFTVAGTFDGFRTINFYPRPNAAKPLEEITPGNE